MSKKYRLLKEQFGREVGFEIIKDGNGNYPLSFKSNGLFVNLPLPARYVENTPELFEEVDEPAMADLPQLGVDVDK